MTHYLTRTGAHDHGSNIVNTFGTLWRLMNESRIQPDSAERNLRRGIALVLDLSQSLAPQDVVRTAWV